jgi:asparagine synthase (glutamine-hydrolysing)
MCGIAGLVSKNPKPHIQSMLQSIEHRGRDDEGIFTSDPIDQEGRQVCLGHRRLAIIDTSSAGHQPMVSSDGRFVITFNGEIYNYRELKALLQSKGHQFQTDSDTEVLLYAFSEWGRSSLSRLNGMFSFAIWDDHRKSLTLARDRLGIKPLYYSYIREKNIFVFGSEVKAILASELVERSLDLEGLDQYLTFLWTPDPVTLFKNIQKVPPGHLLTFNEHGISIEEWWDISFDQIEEGRSEAWWQEQVLETLSKVVKLELVADVPVGSFLSGGVDSSALVALMKREQNGNRVSTYSVGFSPDDLRYDIIPDDLQWARRVDGLLKTDYHEMVLKPDVIELLPKLVYHTDQPICDMAISSYLVSREARRDLKVMLSGMGADEIFAGYPRTMAMALAGKLDFIPGFVRRPLMSALYNLLPGGLPGKLTGLLRNAKKFSQSAAMDFEERYLGFGTYFTPSAKNLLYSADLKRSLQGVDPYSYHRRYFSKVKRADPLNQILYVDLKTYLPCHNLATTDKTSMAVNLEVRVPYLNHELVELSAHIPPELKLQGLKRKYILKRAAERILPEDVVWRKKAGFGAPIRSWIRGSFLPLIEEYLSEERVRSRGLFDAREVRRILDATLSGKEDLNLQVFQLLMLELWQQTFLDSKN